MPFPVPHTYLPSLVNVVKVRPLIKKNQHLTTSTAPHSDALAYFLFPVKKTKRSHSLQQLSRRAAVAGRRLHGNAAWSRRAAAIGKKLPSDIKRFLCDKIHYIKRDRAEPRWTNHMQYNQDSTTIRRRLSRSLSMAIFHLLHLSKQTQWFQFFSELTF